MALAEVDDNFNTTYNLHGELKSQVHPLGSYMSDQDLKDLGISGGYGINFLVLLPTPFIEIGYKLGNVSIRGNLAYVLAYGRISGELAYNNIFNSKYSTFVNAGESGIIQGWATRTIGVGLEIKGTELNKYYRVELVRYRSKGTTPGFGDSQPDYYYPHFAIGYRY